jgi:hypothetical protein
LGCADEAEQADGEGEREQGLAAEQAGVVVEVAGVGQLEDDGEGAEVGGRVGGSQASCWAYPGVISVP